MLGVEWLVTIVQATLKPLISVTLIVATLIVATLIFANLALIRKNYVAKMFQNQTIAKINVAKYSDFHDRKN